TLQFSGHDANRRQRYNSLEYPWKAAQWLHISFPFRMATQVKSVIFDAARHRLKQLQLFRGRREFSTASTAFPTTLLSRSAAIPYLRSSCHTGINDGNVLSRNISTTSISQATRSTAQTATVPLATSIDHQPPLPVRIALVSTTTAIATPAFPAIGFLYAVLRFTVPDANLRQAMEGRWGTLLSFTTWTLLPTLYHGAVASLLLPCAIGNAVVAGSVYGCIDLACGVPAGTSGHTTKAFSTPWIMGSGIGAAVGYIAPNYVYGPVMEYIYGLEGMTQSVRYVMSVPLATEVSVVTGAVAGMILHPLLYYPINGVPGVHWTYFSGLTLALSSSTLYYLYYHREDAGLPVPAGSFVTNTDLELAESVLRYNALSGEVESFSLRSGRFVGPREKYVEGKRIAGAIESYGKTGNVVFDDRLLAFIYNYWDSNLKSQYPDHVVDMKPTQILQCQQESMAITDASVVILLVQNVKCADVDVSMSGTQSALTSILDKINALRKGNKSKLDSLEEVCVAIELLMTLERMSRAEKNSITDPTIVPVLEKFVRKSFPDIMLYKKDEFLSGLSVESQLHAAGWEGSDLSESMNRWEGICREQANHMKRRIGISLLTGVLLSVLLSIVTGQS
ncbi:hypothetical protein ACHAW6_012282, partial [Cyclotella cf. meneghiniana]